MNKFLIYLFLIFCGFSFIACNKSYYNIRNEKNYVSKQVGILKPISSINVLKYSRKNNQQSYFSEGNSLLIQDGLLEIINTNNTAKYLNLDTSICYAAY